MACLHNKGCERWVAARFMLAGMDGWEDLDSLGE
jgi:hypothetical protein